ncbi:tripartite tricarboxylate transporter substrate binding protein [Cupriavidus taiwanensis]|uniref:Putative NagM-like protein n=1 Tax=Cupriavidus taiwanensis TaxID=164546 RepID=A0A375IQU2_9BURK|nr:tripartite tricarboxylate transporter substrate binding protein [Cupriavidus taiwanensis]SOY70416.1 putative NagM-like protein [Cupriavidus taiwanensis]SOY72094.1 putative NagM-like protein [Cupriavidus taiwanensis]SOY95658.1 putative NagM-like protein [Cupriavidus taiwanensis]SOZ29934.1 putative NagM-like protein [Cupriavidus taiwanensis]SOZ74782.1 putative NagM-like protein [Cupriavidus taiwanensis]
MNANLHGKVAGRTWLRLIGIVLLALSWSGAAHAAGYPERPVTLIVPGPPGGSGDITARLVAKELAGAWGQPVLVENRPGAGGIVGAQALMRAPADGYTLMMGNTGVNAINYSLYPKLPYMAADIAGIADVLVFPNVLVVKADSPVRDVADLKRLAAAQRGRLTFSSSGIGQTTHLSGELFKLRTGIDALHVPYKGANLGLAAVMSGEVAFMFDNLPSAEAQLRAGTVRALAVTGAERVPGLPQVPTMAQAGVDDFVVTGWFGLVARAGTPQPAIDAVHRAVADILARKEFAQRLRQLGGRPGVLAPAAFDAFMRNEREQWGRAVKASGATAE